jgi:hypothetical protein
LDDWPTELMAMNDARFGLSPRWMARLLADSAAGRACVKLAFARPVLETSALASVLIAAFPLLVGNSITCAIEKTNLLLQKHHLFCG